MSRDTVTTTVRLPQLEAAPEPRLGSLSVNPSQIALLTLAEASQAVAETQNLDEALRTIAWRAAETLQVPECIVYAYDKGSETITPLAHYERVPSGWHGLGAPRSLAHHPPEKRVLETGSPLLENLSDDGLDPASRESMEKWGIKSGLSIPLLVGVRRMGLMAFYDNERERSFDEAEMTLARGLGALASQALHFAQIVKQTAERNVRLASLLQAGWAINSSLDIDDVLGIVAEHAASALDCDGCLIHADGHDGNQALGYVPRGDNPHLPVEQHLDDPDLDQVVRADMSSRGHGSRLIVPLSFGRDPLGALVAYRTGSDRRFSGSELESAHGLAAQAALAIRNAKQYEELRRVHIGGLRALVGALGAKEPYTQGHGARVAQYVSLLVEKLGWGSEAVQNAEEAGFLHDIGKLVVSDAVLLKSGPLSEREWALMRSHPEVSRDILLPMLGRRRPMPSAITTRGTTVTDTPAGSLRKASRCWPAPLPSPTPTTPCPIIVPTAMRFRIPTAAQNSFEGAEPSSTLSWWMPFWKSSRT